MGSVIGHEFDLPLVGRAHPEQKSGADLRAEATDLEAEDLLQSRDLVDEIYAFRHHSTQEVAYETLLYTQRQQLHRSVALAMLDVRHKTPTQIAHHAYIGQEWPLSLEYNLTAGERAKELFANQQGIDFLEKALKSAEEMSEQDTSQERKAIHLALGELQVSTRPIWTGRRTSEIGPRVSKEPRRSGIRSPGLPLDRKVLRAAR